MREPCRGTALTETVQIQRASAPGNINHEVRRTRQYRSILRQYNDLLRPFFSLFWQYCGHLRQKPVLLWRNCRRSCELKCGSEATWLDTQRERVHGAKRQCNGAAVDTIRRPQLPAPAKQPRRAEPVRSLLVGLVSHLYPTLYLLPTPSFVSPTYALVYISYCRPHLYLPPPPFSRPPPSFTSPTHTPPLYLLPTPCFVTPTSHSFSSLTCALLHISHHSPSFTSRISASPYLCAPVADTGVKVRLQQVAKCRPPSAPCFRCPHARLRTDGNSSLLSSSAFRGRRCAAA